MTPHAVSFTVVGIAQPKGSTKSFGFVAKDKWTGAPLIGRNGKPVIRTATTSDNRSLKGWDANVRAAAQQQCGGRFFDGPVRVAIVFFLPHPESVKKRRPYHVTRPDVDKLGRGCLDVLTGLLWKDDAQVVDLIVRKSYATTQPHARIIVDHAAPLDEVASAQDLFSVLEEVRA